MPPARRRGMLGHGQAACQAREHADAEAVDIDVNDIANDRNAKTQLGALVGLDCRHQTADLVQATS